MGFKCGIVGLPNVGKSTLFNALTQAGIEAANYPFCTIEPNVGIVPVPDSRLQAIADIVSPQQVIPANMQFVDIAGLVAGAAQGEGLGNKFLAHIREVQAIAHVVRCYENADITHVAGKVDPVADITTIDTELCLADMETVAKAQQRCSKLVKSGDKAAKAQLTYLDVLSAQLDAGRPVRELMRDKSKEDAYQFALKELHLLSAKPVLYIANTSEDGLNASDNPHLAALEAHVAAEGAQMVALCASIESELVGLDDEDRAVFLADMNLEEPGLHRLIRAGYKLLGLQTYFTAGVKEVRAWTVAEGATAPQGAGVIHTDFERGFIRAEVIGYDDFIACQGEEGAKKAGKWRLEGKDYVLQDGDVVHFRFNT